jgi:hypothetical protein
LKIEDSTQLGEQNRLQNLTIDYSTDTNGNILSMNYVETGGYHGELFAVSDNSGNIVAWSTILGINNYAAIRDPNNAYIDPIEIYNPNDINVPLGWNGKKGNNITIQQVGTGNDLIFNAGGSGFSITNLWGATDITDSTTTTTTDDTTDKDGGDDAETCGGCPPGTVPICLEWGSNLDWLDCMAKELGKDTLIGEVLNKLGLSSVAGLIGLAISIIEQAVKSILADRNIRSAAQRCTDETINRCKKWGCSEPGGAGAI